MLSKKESLVRFLVAVGLLSLSGTGTVTGNVATICGILGTVELATSLLRYSPLMDVAESYPAINYIMRFGMVEHKH